MSSWMEREEWQALSGLADIQYSSGAHEGLHHERLLQAHGSASAGGESSYRARVSPCARVITVCVVCLDIWCRPQPHLNDRCEQARLQRESSSVRIK